MTSYVALLRAVNVGGTGKLPMADLRAMCIDAGFSQVETYIASGNVIFTSGANASTVKARLESRLLAYAGKPVDVFIRDAVEFAAILDANPFSTGEPSRAVVAFLDQPPARDALKHDTGAMDQSKLKIPAARTGTARNLNTVARLVELVQRK